MRTMNCVIFILKIIDIVVSFQEEYSGFLPGNGGLDFNSLMPIRGFLCPLGMCCRYIKYYHTKHITTATSHIRVFMTTN